MTKTKSYPKFRRIVNGFAVDTESASPIYRSTSWEDSPGGDYGLGAKYGLMMNLHDHYFSYYRDETMEPWEDWYIELLDQKGAIKWMEKHCPLLIEQVFGPLHEPGEGDAYTPKQQK